jgi:hypothetical protein
MQRLALLPLALLAAALCGCQKDKPPATFHSEPHDHAHERDKVLLADAGPYHAALTAHLSGKEGNELDVFFETTDEPPKPVPLPLAKFAAAATAADGKTHQLDFEPAPPEERKGDPDGQCSHFVAKAPWMKPDDVLSVSATVTIHGKPTPVEWKNFNPKKYAHHAE